jgi:predicted lipase
MIIVAFRGSDNVDNTISDIDFFKTPYKQVPGAEVHEGFYIGYSNVSSQVHDAIRPLLAQHTNASILYTGHSLGAALATFAAVDVLEELAPSNTAYFYTFGSPRTGNQAFSDHIMNLYPNYFRMTHAADLVPHLPLYEMGFNHAGTEIWYKNPGLDMTRETCLNTVGTPENSDCCDTTVIPNPDDHMQYVGINLRAGWCSPSTFLK